MIIEKLQPQFQVMEVVKNHNGHDTQMNLKMEQQVIQVYLGSHMNILV